MLFPILWDWCVHEHFDELGFDEAAKNVLARNPNIVGNGQGDWMHINCMSVLGPNKWYDAGDERFHPDNIIWDGRATRPSEPSVINVLPLGSRWALLI